MMEIVKRNRISFSLDDISAHIDQITKDQILEKCRILLDRKEIQINEEIQKLNSKHLLILQKKVLTVEKKDEQIFKLNNTITLYKNQLNDERERVETLTDQLLESKAKIQEIQKHCTQYENLYKEEQIHKENVKRQQDQLLQQIKKQGEEKRKLQRKIKQIQDEKVEWESSTDLLINNQKRVIKQQKQRQINRLKLEKEYEISNLHYQLKQLKSLLATYKKKSKDFQKKVMHLQKVVKQLEKQLQKCPISRVSPEINQEVQTQEIQSSVQPIAYSHAQIQVGQQCQQCLRLLNKTRIHTQSILKSDIDNIHNVGNIGNVQQTHYGVQTMQNQAIQSSQQYPSKCENYSQTILEYVKENEQRQLIQKIKRALEISGCRYKLLKDKYSQLEELYCRRPSRKQDLRKIEELQRKILKMQIQILKYENQTQNFMNITQTLDSQIHCRDKILQGYSLQMRGQSIIPLKNSTTPDRKVSESFSVIFNNRNLQYHPGDSEINQNSNFRLNTLPKQQYSFSQSIEKLTQRSRNIVRKTTVSQQSNRNRFYRKYSKSYKKPSMNF